MNREEAELQAAKFTVEHQDRETHRFLAREGAGGEWVVMKMGLPPVDDARAAEVRADEKPTTPDDPRDNLTRNIGPYAAGG